MNTFSERAMKLDGYIDTDGIVLRATTMLEFSLSCTFQILSDIYQAHSLTQMKFTHDTVFRTTHHPV